MKFDIVIGNPPYQEMDGGGGNIKSSEPLYPMFIDMGLEQCKFMVSYIIPSRWMNGGKKSLDIMKDKLLDSMCIQSIYNYAKSTDIFSTCLIAGGLCILNLSAVEKFQTTKIVNCSKNGMNECTRDLKENDTIIIDNQYNSILNKIKQHLSKTMIDTVSNRRPYGLESFFEDSEKPTETKNIKVICSKDRITYTDLEHITNRREELGTYRVSTGKVSPDHGGVFTQDNLLVLNTPKILKPNEVCTETYLILQSFKTLEQAEEFRKYITSRVIRFLIMITLNGINMTTRNFMYVPDFNEIKELLDFNLSIDEQLYKHFSLNKEDIDIIEKAIRIM